MSCCLHPCWHSHSFNHSFIYLFNRYLLSPCHIRGTGPLWWRLTGIPSPGRRGGSGRPRVATILARITVVAIKLGFPTWNPCSPIHIFSVQLWGQTSPSEEEEVAKGGSWGQFWRQRCPSRQLESPAMEGAASWEWRLLCLHSPKTLGKSLRLAMGESLQNPFYLRI